MAIKQYSLKKDGKTYLAPCFQVKEFACLSLIHISEPTRH